MNDHLNTAWKVVAAGKDMQRLDPVVLQGLRTMFMLGSHAALEALQTGNGVEEISAIHVELVEELRVELCHDLASSQSPCNPVSPELH